MHLWTNPATGAIWVIRTADNVNLAGPFLWAVNAHKWMAQASKKDR